MFGSIETSCLRLKDVFLKTLLLWFKVSKGLASLNFLDLVDSMGIG